MCIWGGGGMSAVFVLFVRVVVSCVHVCGQEDGFKNFPNRIPVID